MATTLSRISHRNAVVADRTIAIARSRIYHRLVLMVLCVWSAMSTLQAQSQQAKARVEHYTQKDGLTYDWIIDMVTDSNNLLWIANGNSVSTYNGFEFQFVGMGGLPHAVISQMHKGDDGSIWVQSLTGDLGWFDPSQNRFVPYAHNDSIRHLTRENMVESIRIRKDGSLWIGCRAKGFYTVSPDGRVKEVIGHASGHHGFCVVAQREQLPFTFSVYDSARSREAFDLTYLNEDLSTRFHVALPDTSFDHASELTLLGDSSFLLATGTHTLCQFSTRGHVRTTTHHDVVVGLLADGQDGLWIGSLNQGAVHYPSGQPGSADAITYANGTDYAMPCAADNMGGVWIGSISEGIYYIPNPYFLSLPTVADSIGLSQNVLSLTNRGDQLFFVTIDNRLANYVPGDPGSLHYYQFGNSLQYPGRMTTLLYDEVYDRIWVGTAEGPTIFNPDNAAVTWPFQGVSEASEKVTIIKKAEIDSAICMVGDNHYLIVKDTELVYRSPTSPSRASDAIHLPDGRAWISTSEGIYSRDGNAWVSLNEKHPDLSREFALFLYENERLWIAPVGRNLVVLENGRLHQVRYNNVFLVNVRSLFVHKEGVLHGSSMYGFFQIELLPSDTFSSKVHMWKQDHNIVRTNHWIGNTINGQYYAPSPAGIMAFDPEMQTTEELKPPTLFLKRVLINGNTTPTSLRYDLEYDQNFIEMEFGQVFHHTASFMVVRLNYFMEGVHQERQNTDRSFISFTTLPPGHYELEVTGYLSGFIQGETMIIEINIAPPYWQTWWFRTLVILLIGLGIYLFIHYRSVQIAEREQFKAKMTMELSRLELRALKAQINPHFIFNSISSVQYYLAKNKPEDAEDYLQRFAKLMRIVLENSESTTVSLKSEVNLMQQYVLLESERFKGSHIHFVVEYQDMDPETTQIPPALFQPYIENAIWHGLKFKKGERRIQIKAKRERDQLVIQIEDNGIGRKASTDMGTGHKEQRSFGMLIASRRIEALNKNRGEFVTITDLEAPDGQALGTRVTISIPFNQTRYERIDC